MIEDLTVIYEECIKTYTNDQVIIWKNGERSGHDKPSFPKMKVHGLEELFDIFQIPEYHKIIRKMA